MFDTISDIFYYKEIGTILQLALYPIWHYIRWHYSRYVLYIPVTAAPGLHYLSSQSSLLLKKSQSDGTPGLVYVDGFSFLRHFNGALSHKVAKCPNSRTPISITIG